MEDELILGIALAVPLLDTLARLAQPDAGGSPGQQFAASSRSTSISPASRSFSGAEMRAVARADRHADGVGGLAELTLLCVGVTSFECIRRGRKNVEESAKFGECESGRNYE